MQWATGFAEIRNNVFKRKKALEAILAEVQKAEVGASTALCIRSYLAQRTNALQFDKVFACAEWNSSDREGPSARPSSQVSNGSKTF